MSAEGSAVDNALVAYLLGDPALATVCPDGVHLDEALPNSKRYLVIVMEGHRDVSAFSGQGGYQLIRYAVSAVGLSSVTPPADMTAAAERIHTLLQDQPLPPVPGYEAVTLSRLEDTDEARIRLVVPDSGDPSLRWYSRGGRYVAHASPIVTPV